MFDGNHRSRRQVNLGGGDSNNKSRGRRRGRASTRPTGGGGSGGVGGNNAHHRPSINSLPGFVAAAVGGGRESILEQTRILREERRQHQLEEKSATKIQKVYRGWKDRKFVAEQTLHLLWKERPRQQQQQQQQDSLQKESFLLSLRLSKHLLHALKGKQQQQQQAGGSAAGDDVVDTWLSEHAESIQQFSTTTTGTSNNYHQQPLPYGHSFRIVQATLSCLRPLTTTTTTSTKPVPLTEDRFLSLCAILEYYLADASLLWKRIGAANGLLQLLQSTQECLWWWYAINNQNQTTATANTTLKDKMQSLWKWACKAVGELQQGSTLQRASQALLAATVMGHHTGISKDPTYAWWCRYGSTTNDSDDSDGSTGPYEEYFSSLVQQVVVAPPPPPPQQQQQELREEAETTTMKEYSIVLNRILHRRWHIVLANGLNWQSLRQKGSLPSTALLQFLSYVLANHNDLAILTSLVVARGGDVVRSLVVQEQPQLHNNAVDDDHDDDDSSLDQEMEEQTAPLPEQQQLEGGTTNDLTTTAMNLDSNNNATVASSATNKRSSNRKLTKQDLQTMPQLDKVYQETKQRQQNQILSTLMESCNSGNNSSNKAYAQSLIDMAIQIGDPSLWIAWGKMVLSTASDADVNMMDTTTTTTTTTNNNKKKNDSADDSTQKVYFQLLARALQSATGLRARTSATSPFLSQLAFSGGGSFIELLWKATMAHSAGTSAGSRWEDGGGSSSSSQDALTCTMLTVFCDVFSHSLVALSDEKFLQQYTHGPASSTVAAAPKSNNKVMAEDVIGYIRNLLHEVYWTKPVVLDDVKLACESMTPSTEEDTLAAMRARFLLSGTKLWGSLYERWCRLVRSTKFCDESAWWFPHLASQEGDNAVVNGVSASSSSRRNNPGGVINMDIDDDESSDDDNDEMDESQREGGAGTTAQEQGADAESDALANSFRDPKMARVLTCIPQALPFDRRVRLFDSLLTADKLKTQDENSEFRQAMINMMRGEEPTSTGRERVEIRRDRLYDDSMRQLNQLGPKLRKKVQVSFVNQHGTQEAGIDGGGVFKEFVDDLIKDAFSLDAKSDTSSETPQLFNITPLQTLTVNSSLTQDGSLLPHYEFLGRVLGKAVYESILVEPQFCLPFLNQLLGKRNSLEDLKNFDMEYYKNLTKLLTLTENEIANLGLTFEITLGQGLSMHTRELLPGGRAKQVTKQNVIQYVHLVSHQRLNVEGAVQTRSFLRGFRDLIPAPWVRLFSAYELQKLISGDDSLRGFDVASLKRAMQYAAGYHPSQPIMQWFWEVLEEFTPEQQRKFLRFMTSCSRQPLLGFSSMDPPVCVQQIRLPDHLFEEDMASVAKKVPLPTSSTCMNLLKLPNYRSKELLRKKLLDAVESGAGFELT